MSKLWARRIIQYIIGIVLMAFAVVLTKRSNLGLSPFSTAPAALNTITGISLGTTTIILHIVCVIVICICQKKITVKTVLTFFVAFPFGWIIDLMMLFIGPVEGMAIRVVFNLIGIIVTAIGVALIVGADLMLPAPDAMLRTISVVYDKSYPLVKNIGDIFWLVVAGAAELIAIHKLVSIGIGTVLAAILVGRIIKLLNKWFPWITLVKKASL